MDFPMYTFLTHEETNKVIDWIAAYPLSCGSAFYCDDAELDTFDAAVERYERDESCEEFADPALRLAIKRGLDEVTDIAYAISDICHAAGVSQEQYCDLLDIRQGQKELEQRLQAYIRRNKNDPEFSKD